MQPSQWNLAELHGPLLSDLLHQTGHIVVSVKNEQALHLYKMHHVMAHLPFVTRIIVRKPNFVCFQEEARHALSARGLHIITSI
jgi:hypothetical protein